MWTKIKAYWYIALGLLVSGLLVAVKILTGQNSRLRRKVETTDAKIKHAKAVIRADVEADREYDERVEEIAREIEKKRTSDELRNPNDW